MKAWERTSKNQKLLRLWIALWILGELLIGFRNDIKLQGHLSSVPEIIIASLYINVIVIPIEIIAWFVIKFVLRIIHKSHILEGKNARINVFLIWLVLFAALFSYGFLSN